MIFALHYNRLPIQSLQQQMNEQQEKCHKSFNCIHIMFAFKLSTIEFFLFIINWHGLIHFCNNRSTYITSKLHFNTGKDFPFIWTLFLWNERRGVCLHGSKLCTGSKRNYFLTLPAAMIDLQCCTFTG